MESSSGSGDSTATPREAGETRSQVAQRHFDPTGDEELTSAIVFAVTEAEGVDPTVTDSPPLYEAVDVDSLADVLFGSEESAAATGRVEFEYRGHVVTVRDDGWIRVFAPSSR
jgi:hypothetical protein